MKKIKTYEISVIDKTYSKIISDETKFYTSDTALELAFELKETEYNFESAEIVLFNVDDRSLATRQVSKTNDGFVYEIDDDVTSHYGDWRGQLMLVENGEVHVSSPVKFRIENDLYCNKPLEITEVVSWVSLKRYADSLVDELKQAVLDVEGMDNTFKANELERQTTFETKESERDETFNANEGIRQTQELEREEAEATRQQAEGQRKLTFEANESERQSAEQQRVEAEKQRNETVKNIEARQNSVETQFNSIQQELTDKDPISAPEIIAARNGEANLKTRLDKEQQEVNARLAQKANIGRVDSYNNTPQSLTVSGGGNTKPFVAFVDDDGRSTCYNTLYPLFESKGIVGNAAITVSQIGSSSYFMTKENLLELQSKGWEIASHNYDEVYFTTGNLTLEEIDYQARKSKEVLSEWGLRVNNYVYTGGQTGNYGVENTYRIIKKYYRSAYSTTGGTNTLMEDMMHVSRFNGDTFTLEQLKAEVDVAFAKKGFLVIMVHSATHSTAQTQKYSDLIDYIQSLNIEIGTLNDGLDIFGNTFDVGTKEKIMTMSNGEIRGNAIGTVFRSPSLGYDIDENTPLLGFERNKITISPIRVSDNINMPSPINEGQLTTYQPIIAMANSSYQTWQQYNQDTVYKRRWLGTVVDGSWGEWVELGVYKKKRSFILPSTNLLPLESKTVSVDLTDFLGDSAATSRIPHVLSYRAEWVDGIQYTHRIGYGILYINFYNPLSDSRNMYASDWDITIFV